MIKEALCQFMKFVGQIEDQVKAQIDQSAPPVNSDVAPATDIQSVSEEPITP